MDRAHRPGPLGERSIPQATLTGQRTGEHALTHLPQTAAQSGRRDSALTQLVNWLVSNAGRVAVPATGGPVERNDYIRRCAAGTQVVAAPAAVAQVISRYAPTAVVMNDFYWDLFGTSRATPYPAADIERACRPAAARSLRRAWHHRGK